MRAPLTMISAALLVVSCATDTAMRDGAAGGGASASLRTADGADRGRVGLSEGAGGVELAAQVSGMPAGTYAIHVHEFGRCDPPTFESAGEHWNPTTAQHGLEAPGGPHKGDLPNLIVGTDGRGELRYRVAGITLAGAIPVLDADGSAVIIHAQPDDNRTQPAGGAGDRLACGVVQAG